MEEFFEKMRVTFYFRGVRVCIKVVLRRRRRVGIL